MHNSSTIPAKEFVPNWRQELENHRVFSNSSTIGRESNSSLPLECKKKKNKVGYLVLATNGLHTIPAKVRTTLDKTHIFPDIWQKNTYLSRYLAKNTYLSRYLAKNTYLSRYLAKQQFFLSFLSFQVHTPKPTLHLVLHLQKVFLEKIFVSMFLGKFQSLLCFLEQIVVPNDTFSWCESFFLSPGGKLFFALPTFPMDKPTFPPLPAERHRAQVSGFVDRIFPGRLLVTNTKLCGVFHGQQFPHTEELYSIQVPYPKRGNNPSAVLAPNH